MNFHDIKIQVSFTLFGICLGITMDYYTNKAVVCPGSPVRDLATSAERVAAGAPPHVGAGNASAPVGFRCAEWVMFEALESTISK
jgi:hypothetical protein